MSPDTPRVQALFERLDRFLALFARMIAEQRDLAPRAPNDAALLKQMLHAQTILQDRRRDLHASYMARAAAVFVHELWSLGGDMPHLDFDMRHLTGSDTLMALRQEISLEALLLTRDLKSEARMTALLMDAPTQTGQSAST
jgi:hypothetical protein